MTDALRSLVNEFVQNLTAAIEQNVLQAMRTTLTNRGPSASKRGQRRVTSGKAAGGRARGQKRDPQELEALTNKLRAYVAKNAGQRIEQIGKGLGIPTKELALPAKKLLAAKLLTTKGQKRATTYFPKG